MGLEAPRLVADPEAHSTVRCSLLDLVWRSQLIRYGVNLGGQSVALIYGKYTDEEGGYIFTVTTDGRFQIIGAGQVVGIMPRGPLISLGRRLLLRFRFQRA